MPGATVISLGQPILRVLIRTEHYHDMKSFWGYDGRWHSGRVRPFGMVQASESTIQRAFFPVIHQPSLQQPFYAGRFKLSGLHPGTHGTGGHGMSVVTDYVSTWSPSRSRTTRLVVWYDPDGVYTSVAEKLDLPHTTVARYDGSFLKLRRDIDGLLNNSEPPKLVVYVPEDQAKTHNALAELEAAGVVMQPGQQPPARNTRLAVVARNASEVDSWRRDRLGGGEAGRSRQAEPCRRECPGRKGPGNLEGRGCPGFRLRQPAGCRAGLPRQRPSLTPKSRRNQPRRNCSPCWEPVSALICPRGPTCPTLGSDWPVMS